MTNFCHFDCVEIGVSRITSRLTKLLFETTLLQRLTKICRRPFWTVCLLLKVAGLVEACMLNISTSYAVFSIYYFFNINGMPLQVFYSSLIQKIQIIYAFHRKITYNTSFRSHMLQCTHIIIIKYTRK